MLAHHFSHYYSWRCQRMVLGATGVMSPTSPDHTKFSFGFQPWNCWGLCSNIDVGPPLFTLLQPEMPTDGVWTSWCDRPLIHGTWKQRFGFPSDFIRHPGIPHVVSVSPFVNNKNPEGNKCAQFNLPPCCHVSLSYVMGLDIELIHQRMQTTRLHASRCYHHYYCRYGNVDFMLFHNFTCYTNSLLSCIHVNTANPP